MCYTAVAESSGNMRLRHFLGHRPIEEGRIAELERKVGWQATEIDFFASMLAVCRRGAEAAGIDYSQLV